MRFRPFKIGRYEFLELLGKGGMGEVYRARIHGARGFNKELAIKRILSSQEASEPIISQFEQEAKISAYLNHPNLIQVFDFLVSEHCFMLVMEFLSGKTLKEIVRNSKTLDSKIPTPIALWIVNEALKGLGYAHELREANTQRPLNLIHRDISPQNIMLTFDGRVKVLDFGIARSDNQTSHTLAGTIKGKINYLAPEQIRGHAIDCRTDIYATGLVLYELLLGRPPFKRDIEIKDLLAGETLESIGLVDEVKTIDPELKQILDQAISANVDTRYQSCKELRSAIETYLLSHFPPVTEEAVSNWIQKCFPKISDINPPSSNEIIPFTFEEEELLSEQTSKNNSNPFKISEPESTKNPTVSLPLRKTSWNPRIEIIAPIFVLVTLSIGWFLKQNISPEVKTTSREDLMPHLRSPSVAPKPEDKNIQNSKTLIAIYRTVGGFPEAHLFKAEKTEYLDFNFEHNGYPAFRLAAKADSECNLPLFLCQHNKTFFLSLSKNCEDVNSCADENLPPSTCPKENAFLVNDPILAPENSVRGIGYACEKSGDGRARLYRMDKSGVQDHLYSTNYGEIDRWADNLRNKAAPTRWIFDENFKVYVYP